MAMANALAYCYSTYGSLALLDRQRYACNLRPSVWTMRHRRAQLQPTFKLQLRRGIRVGTLDLCSSL